MSAQESYLSQSNYGCDMVIAVTQLSVNKAMKKMLSTVSAQEITVCYGNNDDATKVIPADYNQLVAAAGVGDLFVIPTGVYHKDSDAAKADGAGFVFAFRAQLGLPATDASNLPDIVVFDKGTSMVTYHLYCREFSFLNLEEAGGGNVLNWTNLSQTADKPWVFKINVNIGFRSVEFAKLQPDTQTRIKGLNPSTAFSVQQLYLDFNTAGLEEVPEILGLDPNSVTYKTIHDDIVKIFINSYFGSLPPDGVVLGYAVKASAANNGNIIPTDLNMLVSPSLTAGGDANPQEQGLYTINYFVATNNHVLKDPVPFTWNWLDDTAVDAVFDGVIAVNRNILRDYFKTQLDGIVTRSCYTPSVRVTLDSLSRPSYSFSMSAGGTPDVNLTPSGKTVLVYSWNPNSSHDEAGAGGGIGQGTLQPSFTCSMDFTGNTIVITQHLKVYAWVKHLATSQGGNVIDKTITDTYTLCIDPTGKVRITGAQAYADSSQSLNTNGFLNFFTGVNSLVDSVKNSLSAFVASGFTDIPLGMMQNCCFPVNDTFELKDVSFSDYQDLVSHIVYADPSVSLAARRAGALKDSGADSIGVAGTMKSDGFTMDEIAEAIKETWNCHPTDVAYAMHAVGYTLTDISNSLKVVFQISAKDATTAYKALNYTPDEVAKSIKDAFIGDSIAVALIMKMTGYSSDDIAGGIKDAWNCQPQDVIYAMDAAGYTLTDISNSLKDVFKSGAQDVTSALEALHYPGDEAAANIKNAFGGDSIAVASIMKQAGYSADDIARGIKDTWNCMPVDVTYGMRAAGYTLDQISASLKNIFNVSVQDAANAFKKLDYPATDVVQDLKNEFNQDIGFTVCILTDAGYAQADITAGIRSVWDVVG